MASGKFTVNGIPTSAGGVDVANGTVVTFQLEGLPALDGVKSVYSIGQTSKNAPPLVLSSGGIPVPPTSPVTFVAPVLGTHSYELICVVNNGVDAAGVPQPGFTHRRIVAIRSALGLRKILPAETTQYDPTFGWAAAQNEQVDAAVGGGGGGIPPGTAFSMPLRGASVSNQTIQSVAASPGWTVIGAFQYLERIHAAA